MSEAVRCPLCGAADFTLQERIALADLAWLYRRRFRIAIDHAPDSSLDYLHCCACGLGFFSPTLAPPPGFYEKLQQHPWYYLEEKHEYGWAARRLAGSASVLEVGCGEGHFARRLPHHAEYLGLEPNPVAARRAAEQGLRVEGRSIEELAAEGGRRFDAVCAFQVLEHVPDPRSFIEAACALLREGGQLILSVPSEESFLRNEVNNALNLPPHHATRWTDRALRSIGERFGLQLTELEHEPLADMHRSAYAKTMLLGRMAAKRRPLVSRGLDGLVPSAGLNALALTVKLLMSFAPRPRGHSVIGAYLMRRSS